MKAEEEVILGEDVGRDGAVEGHFVKENGVAGDDGVGEAVGEMAVGEAGELGGVGGEFAGGFEEILGGKPVEEAALVPFGEVLGADGDAVEVFGEEGLDFGEGVEPLDEVHAGFAVVEALVELVAEGARETGDFAGAFHRIRGLWVNFYHGWTQINTDREAQFLAPRRGESGVPLEGKGWWNRVARAGESGVALRLPPQSKIAHGWVEGAGMADRVVGMFIFNLPIMAEGMDMGGPSAVCA